MKLKFKKNIRQDTVYIRICIFEEKIIGVSTFYICMCKYSAII